ncbi:MAG: hypothetical protein WCF33_22705, partial [Pseudonocardiaceae bacterium]
MNDSPPIIGALPWQGADTERARKWTGSALRVLEPAATDPEPTPHDQPSGPLLRSHQLPAATIEGRRAAFPAPLHTGYKPRHPTFPQAPTIPTTKAPASVLRAALHQQTQRQHQHDPKGALAGRADLRDGRPSARAGLGRVWTGCGIPPTSP